MGLWIVRGPIAVIVTRGGEVNEFSDCTVQCSGTPFESLKPVGYNDPLNSTFSRAWIPVVPSQQRALLMTTVGDSVSASPRF